MIGSGEILFIMLAVVLLFGTKKLPEIARMLGKGMSEIKKATEDIKKEITSEENEIIRDAKDVQKDIQNTVKKIRIFDNNELNDLNNLTK
jgi:TatA/E family protein of Tat protein translocase